MWHYEIWIHSLLTYVGLTPLGLLIPGPHQKYQQLHQAKVPSLRILRGIHGWDLSWLELLELLVARCCPSSSHSCSSSQDKSQPCIPREYVGLVLLADSDAGLFGVALVSDNVAYACTGIQQVARHKKKNKNRKVTLHILTHGAMQGRGLTSLVVFVNDQICNIRERNMTIRSEIWTKNVRSLGFQDIREWVLLWRLIIQSLGCTLGGRLGRPQQFQHGKCLHHLMFLHIWRKIS